MDGWGTENMQKSANEAAVKKRKCKELQKRFSCFLHVYTFLRRSLHIVALRFSLGYGYLIWK